MFVKLKLSLELKVYLFLDKAFDDEFRNLFAYLDPPKAELFSNYDLMSICSYLCFCLN